ncbi:hypothetical protein RB614_30255 [Phytohabitans sp. ZYX-F-186]|uniref:Mycothiol-dependent maleylpyruvate isomerase metal-binding domain-containing protein n=1 Tax=Phytohabitans maris TaxID=3071409 RepID=A0ABU0ZP48_9ACTN|nr:hypothetical protein [Phytohabitans sp. ZYX-F-186]MDQ7908824.1 hypothetical protein [Phytohabitans sp. ZYX-F-186]
MARKPTVVDVEVGQKKVFAWAVDWPGWCRSARTEEQALAALADYVPRYAVVAQKAGLSFPATIGDTFEVRERLPGDGGTEFGVPGKVSAGDREPVKAAEATRAAKLMTAAWELLAEVAAKSPAELRKGPRGGGRDRDKMLDHVVGAEVAYARQVGIKHKQPPFDDGAAVGALRADLLARLGRPTRAGAESKWPDRYAVRRIVWHVLDHVWEMEDRAA